MEWLMEILKALVFIGVVWGFISILEYLTSPKHGKEYDEVLRALRERSDDSVYNFKTTELKKVGNNGDTPTPVSATVSEFYTRIQPDKIVTPTSTAKKPTSKRGNDYQTKKYQTQSFFKKGADNDVSNAIADAPSYSYSYSSYSSDCSSSSSSHDSSSSSCSSDGGGGGD